MEPWACAPLTPQHSPVCQSMLGGTWERSHDRPQPPRRGQDLWSPEGHLLFTQQTLTSTQRGVLTPEGVGESLSGCTHKPAPGPPRRPSLWQARSNHRGLQDGWGGSLPPHPGPPLS